jgi:shikimate dehydrogenase
VKPPITGRTIVAGVAGQPVSHSLSPLIHNAWLQAAGIDGVYVTFAPAADLFQTFAKSLRGGAIRGLNVTVPFKEAALAVADDISPRAARAAAANLLIFEADGRVFADNTDGLGMLGALAAQAPGFDPKAGPVVVLGAGGAARGAAAALTLAGCPEVRIVNRTLARAEAIAGDIGGRVTARALDRADAAFDGAAALINATSAGLSGEGALDVPLEALPIEAVVMDMVYKPLITPFLAQARARGHPIVDGLEMLVRQAAPSFEAFYGQPPPADVDVRALALRALGQ